MTQSTASACWCCFMHFEKWWKWAFFLLKKKIRQPHSYEMWFTSNIDFHRKTPESHICVFTYHIYRICLQNLRAVGESNRSVLKLAYLGFITHFSDLETYTALRSHSRHDKPSNDLDISVLKLHSMLSGCGVAATDSHSHTNLSMLQHPVMPFCCVVESSNQVYADNFKCIVAISAVHRINDNFICSIYKLKYSI